MATNLLTVEARLVGVVPILIHADRLVDPIDPCTVEFRKWTGKKRKTDADHEEIGRLEWEAGLHFDPTLGPVIPGEMIDATLRAAAKKRKLGKAFEAAVFATDPHFKLEYTGPRDKAGLWADKRFRDRRSVRNQQARVMRTRPKFDEWAVTVRVSIIPEAGVDVEDVKTAFETAGEQIGFADYRPRFGRFVVKNFKQIK